MIYKLLFALVIFFLFGFFHNSSIDFWESLSRDKQNAYLQNKKVNKLAVEVYNGKFDIFEDPRLMKLLDSLTVKNEEIFPFNFYVFNKICSRSDGFVSEMMGKYCIKMTMAYPEYVIKYFSFERKLLEKEDKMIDLYSMFIGEELYYSEQKMSDIGYTYSSFSKILNSYFSAFDEEDKKSLESLLSKIKDSMKNMDS